MFSKKIGCSTSFILFVVSIIGLVLSIDEKTGKIGKDSYLIFTPSIILMFVSIIYFAIVSFKAIPKGPKLSEVLDDIDKNVFSGKSGIRGYVVNPFIKSFICPHCLKSILMEKINHITCPHCEETTDSKFAFYLACPKCFSKIKYFACPKCGSDIDIDAPYNHKELEEKRNG